MGRANDTFPAILLQVETSTCKIERLHRKIPSGSAAPCGRTGLSPPPGPSPEGQELAHRATAPAPRTDGPQKGSRGGQRCPSPHREFPARTDRTHCLHSFSAEALASSSPKPASVAAAPRGRGGSTQMSQRPGGNESSQTSPQGAISTSFPAPCSLGGFLRTATATATPAASLCPARAAAAGAWLSEV